MRHLTIDCETLDTGPRAAILSIGVCAFDPNEPDRPLDAYEDLVDWDDALRHGTVSRDTLRWWLAPDQASALSHMLQGQAIPLAAALDHLTATVEAEPFEQIWFNGPAQDAVWLRHAYAACGKPVPWEFFDEADVRTLRRIIRKHWHGDLPAIAAPADGESAIRHTAKADALWQARIVSAGLRHLQSRGISFN